MQMQQMRREQADRGNAEPAIASAPETQASTIMPVMMVADASTMPIWNAAEATS